MATNSDKGKQIPQPDIAQRREKKSKVFHYDQRGRSFPTSQTKPGNGNQTNKNQNKGE